MLAHRPSGGGTLQFAEQVISHSPFQHPLILDAQRFLDKCLLNELIKDETKAPADVGSQAPGDASFSLELSSLPAHKRSSSN